MNWKKVGVCGRLVGDQIYNFRGDIVFGTVMVQTIC